MKRLLFLILVFSGFSYVLNAQENFHTIYDLEYSAEANQLLEYENRLFVSFAQICIGAFECSSVMEIDKKGEILWQEQLPFLDIAPRNMVIENDTIYITGNDINTGEQFRMHQMSINGGDSLATYDISSIENPFEEMFQLATVIFNNQIIVAGDGEADGNESALIYVVDKTGGVDTLIISETTGLNATVWDMQVDRDGSLIVYIEIGEAFGDDWRIIKKYNADFEEIWSYTTEKREHDRVIPRGTELQDGRIAFVYRHPDLDYISSVRVIDQEGNKDWQYDWFASGKTTTTIFRLRTLSNGDILGSGSYTDYNLEPGLEDAPFIFRMTPDGELLWQKVFFQLNEETDNSKTGTFWDIQELDDGGFMAVGFITNGHRDILIVRTDENGCLIEECEDITVLTATGDLTLEDPLLNVYPNPVNDILYLDFPNDVDLTQIELVNLNGQVVQTFKEDLRQLDLSSLESSIYFLRIVDKEGSVSTKKVIK